MSWIHSALPTSPAYEAVQGKLEGDAPVLADGGVSTELERRRASGARGRREPWGVWALYSAQTEVLNTHRRYVAAGCDVLSTNSWSILEEAESWVANTPPSTWGRAADAALRLARDATEETRDEDCAVAFCINGDLRGQGALGALELLTWRWREQAPDLVIFETLTELPGAQLLDAVGMVSELGLPVWVSMRRAAAGMASVDGQVIPDDDPRHLPRALGELERHGVSAVLVNCVPRELVPEAVSALGAATLLPVGCRPNLGHPADGGWKHDDGTSPEQFAEEALVWLESGARIIGGCCGVGPAHIAALERTRERALAWSARGV